MSTKYPVFTGFVLQSDWYGQVQAQEVNSFSGNCYQALSASPVWREPGTELTAGLCIVLECSFTSGLALPNYQTVVNRCSYRTRRNKMTLVHCAYRLASLLFPATLLKPDDLKDLKVLLQDVAGYWVAIADQLGMRSQVNNIRRSPDNIVPSDFLRDLLNRWINQENSSPTLEALCRALCDDPEIIGGAGVARKLKEKFQRQRGL